MARVKQSDSPVPPRTVRIRVAVIVDGRGNWCVSGRSDMSDEEAYCQAAENADVELSGLEAVRFLEADIPLPEIAPTISAETVTVTGGE